MIEILPKFIKNSLNQNDNKDNLIEVIMDLGRRPEARFPDGPIYLSNKVINWIDLDQCIKGVGNFTEENRAGIERTLHRISCVRNREGNIVGLTCRVGRAVFGTINIIKDLLENNGSILLLGKPGVGKTTAIREIARVLADEMEKRVIIIDTSNEIAGDGDIPHRSIGKARRMQVSQPEFQYKVMIEAVENHMPEVIIIDEIGTEQETFAARTISERGVQLIGTAHGNYLESLIRNPSLSDLVGGIQYVTLGDEEAKRRGTQKSIIERKATPAFKVAVEIHERYSWVVHENIADSVDQILQGLNPITQIRSFYGSEKTIIKKFQSSNYAEQYYKESQTNDRLANYDKLSTMLPFNSYASHLKEPKVKSKIGLQKNVCSLYTFGLSYQYMEKLFGKFEIPIELTRSLGQANTILGLRAQIKNNKKILYIAKNQDKKVFTVGNNSLNEILRTLNFILQFYSYDTIQYDTYSESKYEDQLEVQEEVRIAIEKIVIPTKNIVELLPRTSIMRNIQYQLISKYALKAKLVGKEPNKRIRIYPNCTK
uniref:Conserved hypothetical plastid protein n=1 Tax=Porphyridium purpureum TaxID=35688 RepID=W0RYM5_PORPP|nr:conserved hypothetical plastid protein [Porphyridium purpureum]ATJ02878.1 hypothetical protein [Porphyridium purpureum]BAO23651.1 conserved hypothetical plastid protein [Porphyridium purpureum]